MNICVKDHTCIPHVGSEGAAGLDLKADDDYLIKPDKISVIGTGVRVEVPENHVLIIVPRSSTKLRLINTVGIIDSDYRGEIMVKCRSEDSTFRIQKGERIVQAVLVPCVKPDFNIVTELSETSRGDKGFGSTGK